MFDYFQPFRISKDLVRIIQLMLPTIYMYIYIYIFSIHEAQKIEGFFRSLIPRAAQTPTEAKIGVKVWRVDRGFSDRTKVKPLLTCFCCVCFGKTR